MTVDNTQATVPETPIAEQRAVDMWIDFACPWSYIAHHQIASTPNHEELRVRAFQLNPDLPESGILRQAYRVNKFGSQSESDRRDARVVTAAKQFGLAIDFAEIRMTPNTRNAHRAMKAAGAQGADTVALAEAIFAAYFTSGADIGDPQVLVAIAESVGIGLAAVDLDPSAGHDPAVDLDVNEARIAGLGGVPYFADAATHQPIPTVTAVNRLTGANCARSRPPA